jgi:hypothetical protein
MGDDDQPRVQIAVEFLGYFELAQGGSMLENCFLCEVFEVVIRF